jgi:hypothetical protein
MDVRVGEQATSNFLSHSRLALPSLSIYNQQNSVMGNFEAAKL